MPIDDHTPSPTMNEKRLYDKFVHCEHVSYQCNEAFRNFPLSNVVPVIIFDTYVFFIAEPMHLRELFLLLILINSSFRGRH